MFSVCAFTVFGVSVCVMAAVPSVAGSQAEGEGSQTSGGAAKVLKERVWDIVC